MSMGDYSKAPVDFSPSNVPMGAAAHCSEDTGSSCHQSQDQYPPTVIAEAFAYQFYNALSHCPEEFRRLYHESESFVSRAAVGTNIAFKYTSADHDLFAKFHASPLLGSSGSPCHKRGTFKLDVIEAQEATANGSLIAMIIGTFIPAEGERKGIRRPFAQTFLLEREDDMIGNMKAMWVRNDVLVWLDENPPEVASRQIQENAVTYASTTVSGAAAPNVTDGLHQGQELPESKNPAILPVVSTEICDTTRDACLNTEENSFKVEEQEVLDENDITNAGTQGAASNTTKAAITGIHTEIAGKTVGAGQLLVGEDVRRQNQEHHGTNKGNVWNKERRAPPGSQTRTSDSDASIDSRIVWMSRIDEKVTDEEVKAAIHKLLSEIGSSAQVEKVLRVRSAHTTFGYVYLNMPNVAKALFGKTLHFGANCTSRLDHARRDPTKSAQPQSVNGPSQGPDRPASGASRLPRRGGRGGTRGGRYVNSSGARRGGHQQNQADKTRTG